MNQFNATDVGGCGDHGRVEKPRPNAELILADSFHRTLDSATGVLRKLTVKVRSQLADCIAAEGDDALNALERNILETERQFEPDHAFERTMYAEQLLWVLAGFLLDEWRLNCRLP